MLTNFLYETNRAFIDYKKNRLYLAPQLQEVWLDIRDATGAALSLESFIFQARTAAERQWNENEWLKTISGIFQCSNEVPHTEITTMACNVSFLLGVMFERLRQKRGLTIQTKVRQLSSEEMDSIIKNFDQEMREDAPEEE